MGVDEQTTDRHEADRSDAGSGSSAGSPADGGFEVVSRVSGPIADMSTLEASLLFAEISRTAYLDPADAEPLFNAIGFDSVTFFERDGAQAYRITNDNDLVVVCRGTEPDDFNDLRADLNALTAVAATIGRVHRGFQREVDDLWPRIAAVLADRGRAVWFAGHSLGGAMAWICAHRCAFDPGLVVPSGVYTFGSPRVGNRAFVRHGGLRHQRWVNNNDLVTRVPPVWMGYQHSGTRRYIDSSGRVRRVRGRAETRDRWSGFVTGVKRRRIDLLSDHAIAGYVLALRGAVERSRSAQPRSGPLRRFQRLRTRNE